MFQQSLYVLTLSSFSKAGSSSSKGCRNNPRNHFPFILHRQDSPARPMTASSSSPSNFSSILADYHFLAVLLSLLRQKVKKGENCFSISERPICKRRPSTSSVARDLRCLSFSSDAAGRGPQTPSPTPRAMCHALRPAPLI